jgi:outer membrane protein assembly factor BamB
LFGNENFLVPGLAKKLAVSNGIVYASDGQNLWAFNATNGTKCWGAPIGAAFGTVIDYGVVLLPLEASIVLYRFFVRRNDGESLYMQNMKRNLMPAKKSYQWQSCRDASMEYSVSGN